jgi:DNA-binding LacI/PurR family transcriptional regulator
LLEAASKLNVAIPQDLSLITFGDYPLWVPGLSITTMLLPQAAQARTSVEMVLTKIQNPMTPVPPQTLKFTLAAGNSCAQLSLTGVAP